MCMGNTQDMGYKGGTLYQGQFWYGWVGMKNMYIWWSPMQNRADFGTPRFSTPQQNMDVSS